MIRIILTKKDLSIQQSHSPSNSVTSLVGFDLNNPSSLKKEAATKKRTFVCGYSNIQFVQQFSSLTYHHSKCRMSLSFFDLLFTSNQSCTGCNFLNNEVLIAALSVFSPIQTPKKRFFFLFLRHI